MSDVESDWEGEDELGERPYGGRPYGGRPYGGRPYGGRPYGGRPYGGRLYEERPYGGRPYGGRPYGGRPYGGQAVRRSGPTAAGPTEVGRTAGGSAEGGYRLRRVERRRRGAVLRRDRRSIQLGATVVVRTRISSGSRTFGPEVGLRGRRFAAPVAAAPTSCSSRVTTRSTRRWASRPRLARPISRDDPESSRCTAEADLAEALVDGRLTRPCSSDPCRAAHQYRRSSLLPVPPMISRPRCGTWSCAGPRCNRSPSPPSGIRAGSSIR